MGHLAGAKAHFLWRDKLLLYRIPMERAQLNLSLQYKITKHMGKPLILSESRKTTNGRLRPLRLKILE